MFSRGAAGTRRRLVTVFLAVTVIPVASILWFANQLLAEDQRLARDQADQHLGRAADQVVSALEREIAVEERRVAAGQLEWDSHAVLVVMSGDGVDTFPRRAVAYRPIPVPLSEADASAFDLVDQAEFQRSDRALAGRLLDALRRSPDGATRAHATFRRGRTHELERRHDEAKVLYTQLEEADQFGIGGVPISLIAASRLCEMDSTDAEACRRLHASLVTGRWGLAPSVYSVYVENVDRHVGPHPHPTVEERLARAVETLWAGRSALRDAAASVQRRRLDAGGEHLTLLWQQDARGTRGLIVLPEYETERWMPAAAAVARAHQVEATIPPLGSAPGPGVRESSATSLPWDVVVSHTAASLSQPQPRRVWLLISAGLVLAMTLMLGYSTTRAVSRELAAVRLQTEFVAAVSHEFRTPLTSLRQFTDMLRENPSLGARDRRLCYDGQARSTERLTNLVESVLDFGRIEAGKHIFSMEPIDCGAFVSKVVAEFQQDIQDSGYTIHAAAGAAASIQADTAALGRALRNLLENAVKYSPGDRTVDVGVREDQLEVQIAVRDRGIGIHPGERRAIFERFHRGVEARARGIGGAGIGLAMAEHIVRAHRGRIDVESVPGSGSTFTIVLPRTSATPS
jgi:signal transduction histidine kinase